MKNQIIIFFFSLEKKKETMSNSGNQLLGTVMLFSFVMFCVQKVMSGKTMENFINYPQTVMVDTVNPQTGQSIPGNNQAQLIPPVYTVNGTQESPLSPRFSSTGYGANITYNLPEVKNLAVEPNNPLQLNPMQYANMVEKNEIVEKRENFTYPSGSPPHDAQQKRSSLETSEAVAALPIQNMSMASSSGKARSSSDVPLNMDRFIVANRKSRLYGQGDYIRGDIQTVPVLPNSDPNSCVWFRPSVNPSRDLNPGAMAVLGGAYNETNRQTVQLQMQSNSGSLNTFSGVSWTPPANTAVGQALIANAAMAAQKQGTATQGAPFGDVSYNAASEQAYTTMFP